MKILRRKKRRLDLLKPPQKMDALEELTLPTFKILELGTQY